ncbi:response regulator [Aeromonas sp. Marseille-Q7275]
MSDVNILIIDDNYDKISLVGAEINGLEYVKLEQRNNVKDALSYLKTRACDILIVDIVLPKILGEVPVDGAGVELIDMLFKNKIYNHPLAIIAVTSHHSTYECNKNKIECFGVPFIYIEPLSNPLKTILNNKIKYCLNFKSKIQVHSSSAEVISKDDIDKITVRWLLCHVTLGQWSAILGVVISIFSLGVNIGQSDWYQKTSSGINNNEEQITQPMKEKP